MLRSGQMMFAQCLRNHLRKKEEYKKTYMKELLLAFADDDKNEEQQYNYSIQKIVKVT